MGMRETEGSLRLYFIVGGLIALFMGLRDINTATQLGSALDDLPASWKLAIWFPILGRMGLGCAYVIAGIQLKTALQTGAGWIQNLLLVAIAILVIDTILVASVLGSDLGRRDIVSSCIGLAITAYLLANLRRLAAEAMAKNPPARVA
jgi:hypothetical protein